MQFTLLVVVCNMANCGNSMCSACFIKSTSVLRSRDKGTAFLRARLNPFWLCLSCYGDAPESPGAPSAVQGYAKLAPRPPRWGEALVPPVSAAPVRRGVKPRKRRLSPDNSPESDVRMPLEKKMCQKLYVACLLRAAGDCVRVCISGGRRCVLGFGAGTCRQRTKLSLRSR
jgi:hypothetical protein